MTRSVLFAVVAVVVAVMLVTAWRERPNGAATAADTRTAVASVSRATPSPPEKSASPVVQPAVSSAPATLLDPSPAEPELKAVIEGVDPLLRERNFIVRALNSQQPRPGFVELESRFGTEPADASWSRGMEARILDQVAQINGLKLVSLEAECRATICRLKLLHPAGTNALSSLDRLLPVATAIGFSQVVQGATAEEDGVPISLLYFQREQDPTAR